MDRLIGCAIIKASKKAFDIYIVEVSDKKVVVDSPVADADVTTIA